MTRLHNEANGWSGGGVVAKTVIIVVGGSEPPHHYGAPHIMMLVVLLSCVQMASAAAGGYVGVSSNGLVAVANSLVPSLVKKVQGLKVKDVKTHKSGFDIHLYDMRVNEFKCPDSCIVPEFHSNGEIEVKVPKFKIEFHIHASVTKSFFHTSTKCDARIGDGHISASGTLSPSGGSLQLSGVDASADVGHIDPNCGGGITGSIIDAISQIFYDKIKHQLDDLVQDQLKQVVEDQAKALLSGIDWTITLEKGLAAIDFTPQSVASTGDHLSLGVKAELVNPSHPEDPPAPSPTLPAWSSAAGDAYLQVLLSTWSLDSVAYTYWRLGRLHRTITRRDAPELNTTFVGLFAPVLLFKYPKHWMAIESAFSETPRAVIDASGVLAHAPATFTFNVVNASGGVVEQAFIVGANVTVSLDFGVVTGAKLALSANITKATFPLEIVHSNVGTVHVGGLSNFTNKLVDNVLLPAVNGLLSKGLPLPTSPALTIESATVSPLAGYLLVATKFQVKPP